MPALLTSTSTGPSSSSTARIARSQAAASVTSQAWAEPRWRLRCHVAASACGALRRRGRARRCARRRRRSAGTARAQPARRAGDHHRLAGESPLPLMAARLRPASPRAPAVELEHLGRGLARRVAEHLLQPRVVEHRPVAQEVAAAPARTASAPAACSSASAPCSSQAGSTQAALAHARGDLVDGQRAVAGDVVDAGRAAVHGAQR